jgi:lytic cellulose monooxygenase (C1-hydroxylating)
MKQHLADFQQDQMTLTGGGSNTPATVNFPGAYKASDPGILIDIHSALKSYTVPGPAVIQGGTTVIPGKGKVCKSMKMIRGLNSIF